MNISNAEFLSALFGGQAGRVHVTGFSYDPGAIPDDRHLAAWAGGYFQDYKLTPGTNQYFTVSLFAPDEAGKARRRKALFQATYVIVLDDVKEKLSLEGAQRLPAPTWILETSPGSEQWGYRLDVPCTDRGRVENLLDGLVANGLAPDGRDPGMKGVTRYVRLPEGVNTKASKALFGMPFKCDMRSWHPERSTTLEALAAPFNVNLDAVRRDQRVDGASDIPDHPLLGVLDVVHVKEVRSAGRFDITCPWVHEHTGGVDNGAAVFTNDDGSIGFKCHHGACQARTGRDLLDLVESQAPGFRAALTSWKAQRAMAVILSAPDAPVPNFAAPVSFLGDPTAPVAPAAPVPPPAASAASDESGLQPLVDMLRRQHPTSAEAKRVAVEVLRLAEDLCAIDQLHWHDQVRDLMGWSKTDFTRILRGLKDEWYTSGNKSVKEFYSNSMFVKELNQFYNWKTRTFMTVDGFTNAYIDEDAEARKGALQDGFVRKVDRLDYAPGHPRIFEEGGILYGNMYYGDTHPEGVPGPVEQWLAHWDALGWGFARDHMLQFMAYTILHPERKINHMMIMGSREGCGKDFLLYPLLKAMGEDARVIDGDALVESYTGYLNGVKYLHINETELGDRKEALLIANKLKPIAAAPPETIRVREMYTKPFFIRNLVNGTMTTNSRLPVRLRESRRFFAVWSDLQTRGSDGNMLPAWREYWERQWSWMKGDGYKHCIWYLRNCVDLSMFNPGAPPPVTDFLREIQDESKPPVQKTLEEFIEHRVGMFASDLVTIKDMLATVKIGELHSPDLMYADYKAFNVQRISQALRDMGIPQLRAKQGLDTARVWAVRDRAKYEALGPSELYTTYQNQLNGVRQEYKLHAV